MFLHVWRQAEKDDPTRATVTGWILMLTRSRAIDRLPARKARPPLESRDLEWGHEPGDNQQYVMPSATLMVRARCWRGSLRGRLPMC